MGNHPLIEKPESSEVAGMVWWQNAVNGRQNVRMQAGFGCCAAKKDGVLWLESEPRKSKSV